jgi:hypothetical protein
MKTLTEQYRSIIEGKGPKDIFLKEAKLNFPNLIKNNSTFKEASTILKQKGIISENFVGTPMVGNPIERKKENYELAFAKFLVEDAKAEEKKVSKEVEETEEHNYDYEDKKDPNNMIFGQIQMGYYYEMKQEKNADKTIDEIKDIVFKNLAKDPIYYTKEGQFGEDIGYTDDAPSLGPTDEPKGKYKSSGYGNLKENKEPVNEIAIAGGIVAGGGFTSQNYMDFYGLSEEDKMSDKMGKASDILKDTQKQLQSVNLEEKDESKEEEYFEALTNAAEKLKEEENLSVNKIVSMLENHLNLKYRDQED